MRCSTCGYDNPPGMRFCGNCGSQLPGICPDCGFANPPDFRFCGMCSRRLTEKLVEPVLSVQASQTTAKAPEEPSTVQLAGERRLATIVVADVVRSTSLLERVGTEAWVEIMSAVLQIVESEIYRYGGRVDQFRGDGLVASFGATSVHEDDPERAVLAALAAQDAIKTYADDLARRQDLKLLLRLGVNSGEIIVANIGDSSPRGEDTAMGEAIAVAARMEAAARPGTVLVSEHTYHLVQSQFEWEDLGRISVKGLSRTVAVYRPLAPRPDAQRSLRLRSYGLSPLLVGRDDQFDSLRRRIEDLRDGRGSIVTLVGDEGMGKSHLLAQVRQYDVREQALRTEVQSGDGRGAGVRALTWLQGRCRSYERSSPYSMWLELFRGWLGMREGEPKAQVRDRLRLQSEVLWGYHTPERYPFLATLLGLPLEDEFAGRVRHLDAEGTRQQIFVTVQSWVEAMSVRSPLVLAFDDAHWADATSLELLEYCLPICEQQAVLWWILCRLDRASAVWELLHRVETHYPHRLEALTLGPLDEAQSAEMINWMIGSEVLPEETRSLLIRKAEGNPYYIEELVRSLIMEGVLARHEQTGAWVATQTVTSLDLPDTLRGLLLARIDDLSADQRRVLQMAAVIGQVFWSNVLCDLVGDGKVLDHHLRALQRGQMIRDRGHTAQLGIEYVFNSALIRDVAYESLLGPQKAAYHRSVAEYLEDFFGTEAFSQYDDLLAYHYRCAGQTRKGLSYTLKAAERAKEAYANAEALRHFSLALELLEKMEVDAIEEGQLHSLRAERFQVIDGRREVLSLMGDLEGVRREAEALLQLAQQLEAEPAWTIDALLRQPGVASWQTREELMAGVPLAERALALAQRLGDQRRQMQSLVAIANQRLYLNDPTAWELAERALGLARQLGDRAHEVEILTGMGQVYAWSDQARRGDVYLREALSISQAQEDRIAEMRLLHLIGMGLERDGDYYRLLHDYEQKRLLISREIGHRQVEGDALMHCGQIQGIYLGDHQAGLRLLQESRDLQSGRPDEMLVLLRVVQILVAQGKLAQAVAALEVARDVYAAHPSLAKDAMAEAGLNLVSAALYQALGGEDHLDAARGQVSRITVLVEKQLLSKQYEMAAAHELAGIYLGLSECAHEKEERQSHLERALEQSQVARELYRSFGGVQVIECVSEAIFMRHSRALAASGDPGAADEYLELAYQEMMRKHDLIPPGSPFRLTFLGSVPLHREIRTARAARRR